jgi:uncharacterized protein RhaS with RHS repeats
MGRFTSPDAPFADQKSEDPQSWNLYNYVGNNPLSHVDEDGRGKIGVFYKVILKPIIVEGQRVMYRKTTDIRISRDEAKRLLRKEQGNVYAPGRKSAKNIAGKGAREDAAHSRGAGERGPHFNPEDGGHSFHSGVALIPGANLGKDIFGDNLVGQAADLINPLADLADAVDIYNEWFGPSDPGTPAPEQPDQKPESSQPSQPKKPGQSPKLKRPELRPVPCHQLNSQPCGGN